MRAATSLPTTAAMPISCSRRRRSALLIRFDSVGMARSSEIFWRIYISWPKMIPAKCVAPATGRCASSPRTTTFIDYKDTNKLRRFINDRARSPAAAPPAPAASISDADRCHQARPQYRPCCPSSPPEGGVFEGTLPSEAMPDKSWHHEQDRRTASRWDRPYGGSRW